MTTLVPHTPITPEPGPTEPPEQLTPDRDLTLRLWRPTSTAIVVHIAGELNASTAPQLHQLLMPRLASMAETVILDLSEVRFLGVAGLELLAHARRRAASRAMTLCIVDGPICVDRALHAAGWNGITPTYATVEAAVADFSGRRREHPMHAVD